MHALRVAVWSLVFSERSKNLAGFTGKTVPDGTAGGVDVCEVKTDLAGPHPRGALGISQVGWAAAEG